jgi:hypothetical protein
LFKILFYLYSSIIIQSQKQLSMSRILKLLASESFLTVNKYVIQRVSLYGAVIYADLASSQLYWNNKEGKEDVWFYRTREVIEEQTSLSPKLQRKAIDQLTELKLIKTELAGLPAKMHYLIDSECETNLLNLLNSKVIPSCAQKSQQEEPKEHQLDEPKSDINKNKENKNKEKEKKNDKEQEQKLSFWLSNFYSEQSFVYLLDFSIQPTEKFIREQISKLGEDSAKRIFIAIEKYCTKNTSYSKDRKNLSQVFNKFAKTFKSALIEDAEQVISGVYSEIFDEQYQFSISCSKHLAQLIEKIRVGFATYSNIAPEQVEDDSLIEALQSFFSKLPEKYKSAEQFKLPLINHNYQSIKNEIRTQNNSKSGSKNINTQGVGNIDSRYGI